MLAKDEEEAEKKKEKIKLITPNAAIEKEEKSEELYEQQKAA